MTSCFRSKVKTSRSKTSFYGCVLSAAFATALAFSGAPARAATVLVSNGSIPGIAAADSASDAPSLSGDGKKVAFHSSATNLASGDNRGLNDVFVRDVASGAIVCASVNPTGLQGNANSTAASLSSSGTKVAFQSDASDLVSGDTNGVTDIFLRDLSTGITTRVSVDSSGAQSNGGSSLPFMSADGTKVAFRSSASNLVAGDTNGLDDIFVRDLTTGTTTRASVATGGAQANGQSLSSCLSADGHIVAFSSNASNLAGGDTNTRTDIFVRNLTTGTTNRILGSSGQFNVNSILPSLSASGSKVAFESGATNVVTGDTNGVPDIFVCDMSTGTITRASTDSLGRQGTNESHNPVLSADGNKVAFMSLASNLVDGDTDNNSDIFVHDLSNGATTQATFNLAGTNSSFRNDGTFLPSLSGDATTIAFASGSNYFISGDANGTRDVFVHVLAGNTNLRASQIKTSTPTPSDNLSRSNPNSLSADGTKVLFQSYATNIEGGGGGYNIFPNVFVRDLTTGLTTRVNVTSSTASFPPGAFSPCISADGTKVAFTSSDSTLVAGDTNGTSDVFIRNLATGITIIASLDSNGIQGNGESYSYGLSTDGNSVVFSSAANNLVPDDTNGKIDVFVRNMTTGKTTLVSVDNSGNQGNDDSDSTMIGFSSDGTKVTFTSAATNLVPGDTNGVKDVFLRDLSAGTTTRLSVNAQGDEANKYSDYSCLSADGSKVAFCSDATNLASDDTNNAFDVFVRDLNSGTVTLVARSSSGAIGDGGAIMPSLSADGTKVAFYSPSANLVSSDTNNALDVFVRNLATGVTTRASVSSSGAQGNSYSVYPSLSSNGTKVAYTSLASNLVSGDTNNQGDVFLSDVVFPPTLSINDVTVTEGSGTASSNNAVFTVTLSAASASVVSVHYALTPITADSNDYGASTPSNGTPQGTNSYGVLSIPSGQTTGTITIPINPDSLVEPDETFAIDLSEPVGAELSRVRGLGTILNDDHVPVASTQTPDVLEDTGTVLTLGGTDADNDALTFQINTLPAHGTLYDGSDASAPAITTVPAALTAKGADKNKVFYVPAPDTNGADAFDFAANDGSNASAAATISLNVVAVNDAPSFTKGADQNAPKTGGAQSVPGWAKALSAGPANESGQSLDFSLSNSSNALFAAQPAVAPDGTLTYTPQPGAAGSAIVTVRVHDNGGTDNGGVDTSAPQTFVITIPDTSAPVVTINTPTANQKILIANLTVGVISGNATDNVGVTRVLVRFSRKRGTTNYYWNGTDFVTAQSTVNADLSGMTWTLSTNLPPTSQLDVGAYAVQVSAYDAANNKSAYADRSFNLSGDFTAPVVAITVPTANQKITITDFVAGAARGTATDDQGVTAVKIRLTRKVGTVTYSWNGSDFVTANSVVDADLTGSTSASWQLLSNVPPAGKLTAGAYSIAVYALDAAGNKSATVSTSFSLSSDFVAPMVDIVTPAQNAILNANNLTPGTFRGTAGDNEGVIAVKLKIQRKRGTITEYWNGSLFTTTVALVDATVSTVGGTSVTWSLGSAIPAAALDKGGYLLYATAYDAAGNFKTSGSRVFNVIGAPVLGTVKRSAGDS